MTEYAEGTHRNAADEQDRQDLTFSMAGLYRGYVKCVPIEFSLFAVAVILGMSVVTYVTKAGGLWILD